MGISVRTFADVTQLSMDKRFSILTHLFLGEGSWLLAITAQGDRGFQLVKDTVEPRCG